MGQMIVLAGIGLFALLAFMAAMVYRLAVAAERVAKCQESLLRDEQARNSRRPFEVHDTVEISTRGRPRENTSA